VRASVVRRIFPVFLCGRWSHRADGSVQQESSSLPLPFPHPFHRLSAMRRAARAAVAVPTAVVVEPSESSAGGSRASRCLSGWTRWWTHRISWRGVCNARARVEARVVWRNARSARRAPRDFTRGGCPPASRADVTSRRSAKFLWVCACVWCCVCVCASVCCACSVGRALGTPPATMHKRHHLAFACCCFVLFLSVLFVCVHAGSYAEIRGANFTAVTGGFGATTPPQIAAQIAAAEANGLGAIVHADRVAGLNASQLPDR
jgi:hypothetical protein